MSDEHDDERGPQAPAKATPARKPGPQSREDRLKAALKANMGRRKMQARARSADEPASEPD